MPLQKGENKANPVSSKNSVQIHAFFCGSFCRFSPSSLDGPTRPSGLWPNFSHARQHTGRTAKLRERHRHMVRSCSVHSSLLYSVVFFPSRTGGDGGAADSGGGEGACASAPAGVRSGARATRLRPDWRAAFGRAQAQCLGPWCRAGPGTAGRHHALFM